MRQLGKAVSARNQHLRTLSDRASGFMLCKPKNKHTSPTRTTHQADTLLFTNEQLDAFSCTSPVWNNFLTIEKPTAKFWQKQSIMSELFHLERKPGLGRRELSSCGTVKPCQDWCLYSSWNTQSRCPANPRPCPLGFTRGLCICPSTF